MKVKNCNSRRFYKSLHPNKIKRTIKNLTNEELINYWNRFNKKYHSLPENPPEDETPIYIYEDRQIILDAISARGLSLS